MLKPENKLVIEIIKEFGSVDQLLLVEGLVFIVDLKQSFFFRLRKETENEQFKLIILGNRSSQKVWFPPNYRSTQYNDRSVIEFIAMNSIIFSEAVN
jgi:hypothetical protein